MTAEIDYYEDEEELTQIQSRLASYCALLGAFIVSFIARQCHGILIPQVLEENAYFVGECGYFMMYLFAAPMGAVLGFSTFLAVKRHLKQPESAAHGLSTTGVWITGLVCVFWSQAFRPTDPILKQDSLYYILSANVPWTGPILLWALFMVFWSLQIRRRYQLGMEGFFSPLIFLIVPAISMLYGEFRS